MRAGIINGIDFDERLDRSKLFNYEFIDLLFDVRNILDAPGKTGIPAVDIAMKIMAIGARKSILFDKPILQNKSK